MKAEEQVKLLEKVVVELSKEKQMLIFNVKKLEADKVMYWSWYEKANKALEKISPAIADANKAGS